MINFVNNTSGLEDDIKYNNKNKIEKTKELNNIKIKNKSNEENIENKMAVIQEYDNIKGNRF